jgi:hypothetical protein
MSKVTTNARARKEIVKFSDELLSEMLEQVASGESLNQVCKKAGMPTRKTFYKWVADDESVRNRYEAALSIRADWVFDQIIEIADEPVGSTMGGGTDAGAVAKQKLQVDARKWVLSKMEPKKYGDRTQVDQNLTVRSLAEALKDLPDVT